MDTVGGFKFVQVCGGQDVPEIEALVLIILAILVILTSQVCSFSDIYSSVPAYQPGLLPQQDDICRDTQFFRIFLREQPD